MLLAWMSFVPAQPVMNLPVLVDLRVFCRRIGSNPKGFSTAAFLQQSTNVSTYNDAYPHTYAPSNQSRKQLAALSTDRELAEEKPARTCGHGLGRKEQAARGEQDAGCDGGRVW